LPAGFQVSATLQNLPGLATLASRSYSTAEVQSSLGRPLAGGARTVTISNLIVPNTEYGERLTQLDVRLTRAFQFGRARVRAMVDLYNLFNGNTILTQNATFGSTWLRPTAIQAGRLLKFGGQLDWY
jgi:hypothetical protein